jgi:hypothetical protein
MSKHLLRGKRGLKEAKKLWKKLREVSAGRGPWAEL